MSAPVVINQPETTSPFDNLKHTRVDGYEYWSARELMPLMGYGADWRNLGTAIERAKLTALNTGEDVSSLFVDVTEKTGLRVAHEKTSTSHGMPPTSHQ